MDPQGRGVTPIRPIAPPRTEAEAIAWVYWAESEIGPGFHPDTPSYDYGEWVDGEPVAPVFTTADFHLFDEGLAMAHALLPDIYATSLDFLTWLHPHLITIGEPA